MPNAIARLILLAPLALPACGPAEPASKCTYAELAGTCALVEADDLDPNGSPGEIRVRYRLVRIDAPILGNHVVVNAVVNPEKHKAGLDYFRQRNTIDCSVGVRAQGDTCPDMRVLLDLPDADSDLKLNYTARVVSDRRAQPEHERPFGDGRATPWP
ncbi:MAG: hypothetical protein KC549_16105 [Myxococcales bacterium]|nr:hypothetical protein [Myxococcales bacterium]